MAQPSVSDTRLLGKPGKFSGRLADWTNWRFEVMNYLQLVDAQFPDDIERAMTRNEPIDPDPEQQPIVHTRGRTLFAITVTLLNQGRAFNMARSIKSRCGWELWRQFALEYEPARAARALVQLTDIINVKLEGHENTFRERLMNWECMIDEYESQHTKTVDVDILRAILLAQSHGY